MARFREKRPLRTKARTLGALQSAFFQDLAGVGDMLSEAAPDASHLLPYHVVRASAGTPELRTDVENHDGLAYLNFSPPPGFGPRYSILRIRFLRPVKQKKFMSHAGEEVLIPLSKGPRYHFYWSRGNKPPQVEVMRDPLLPGSAIRINPQLPHHGLLREEDAHSADAWMVFRHASEVPTSISIAQKLKDKSDLDLHRRQFTEDELDPLKHRTRYALVAWGLAEAIRIRRLSADLSLADVATACGIDRSLLSRIENEAALQKPGERKGPPVNVSLTTLFHIADFLHIDVLRQIRNSQWHYRVDDRLNRKIGDTNPIIERSILCDDVFGAHLLHVCYWDVLPGSRWPISPKSNASSWIVLSGRAVFDIQVPNTGLEDGVRGSASSVLSSTPEIVDAGSVLHFKVRPTLYLQALEPTRIVEVEYSHECPGGQQPEPQSRDQLNT